MTRKDIDELQAFAKEWGGKGLAHLIVEPDGELRSPILKFLSEAEVAAIREATGAEAGSVIFLAADSEAIVTRVLGALRAHLAERFDLIDRSAWKFLYVVDFPLFKQDEETGGWAAEHHMFTAPIKEHEDLIETDPGAVISEAYDMVVNGLELASGSIRINRPDLQQRVFDRVGFAREDAEERFGFLLRALRYGAPPHGGMAPGLDRTVMLLAGTDNLREVIAFPKTGGGFDPLTAAPAPVGRRAARGARAADPAAGTPRRSCDVLTRRPRCSTIRRLDPVRDSVQYRVGRNPTSWGPGVVASPARARRAGHPPAEAGQPSGRETAGWGVIARAAS